MISGDALRRVTSCQFSVFSWLVCWELMFSRREFLKLSALTGLVGLPALLTCSNPQSLPTTLHIVPRAAWGAGEPDLTAEAEHGLYDPRTNPDGWREYAQPLADVLHTVIVHHAASFVKQHPRDAQKWHRERLGLADIGYHFVINAQGTVYEGRPINVRGAHTGGHNTGAVGVVLFGHFELWRPAKAQMAALRLLVTYLRDTYAVRYLGGHRDFQPDATVCPGQHLALLLPELAAELGLMYGTGGFGASDVVG